MFTPRYPKLSLNLARRYQYLINTRQIAASNKLNFQLNLRNAALLSQLPSEITQSKLSEILKDVDNKDFRIQPGCSLHFLEENSAKAAAKYLSEKLNLKATQKIVKIPQLQISNLNNSVNQETIKDQFERYKPLRITINESNETYSLIRFDFDSANDISVESIFDQSKLNNVRIKSIEKVSLPKPALFIRNLMFVDDAVVDEVFCENGANEIRYIHRSPEGYSKMAVALFDTESAALAAYSKFKDALLEGLKFAVTYKEIMDTVIFIENWEGGESPSEVEAEEKIHSLLGEHIECSVVLSETGLPAVIVHDPKLLEMAMNILISTGFQIKPVISGDYGVKVELEDPKEIDALMQAVIPSFPLSSTVTVNGRTGVVDFEKLYNAQRALATYQKTLSVADSTVSKVSLTTADAYVIEVNNLDKELSVSKLLEDYKAYDPKADVFKAERNAVVRFKRAKHVVPGMKALKKIDFGDGTLCKVDRYRPLVAQLDSGFEGTDNESFLERFDKSVTEQFLKSGLENDPAARYQFLKNEFERKLFDAEPFDVSGSDEDVEGEDSENETEDEDSGTGENTEEKESENETEEEDSDTNENLEEQDTEEEIKEEDVGNPFIDESVPDELRREASHLLEQYQTQPLSPQDKDAIKQRLFDIFVQQSDYLRFSKDFAQLKSLFGDVDDKDPFHWSKMKVESEEELNRLYRRALADEGFVRFMAGAPKETVFGGGLGEEPDEELTENHKLRKAEKKGDALKDFVEQDEHLNERHEGESDGADLDEDDKKERELQDFDKEIDEEEAAEGTQVEILDEEGRLWTGFLIHTDMVRNTIARGRIISYRALVVVGNGRGTGGYGVGKGTDPDLAVDHAYRTALKNLIHIDLFDNHALAHDVVGAFNNTKCFIRAMTPKQVLKTSEWGETLLHSMGITSGSLSFVGRKDPYARIAALFNALKKHQNLDEFAKARGKRYLTEKWIREQNV